MVSKYLSASPTPEINLNWGSKVDPNEDFQPTDMSSLFSSLSSYGRSRSGGGFDFKMPSIPDTSGFNLGGLNTNNVSNVGSGWQDFSFAASGLSNLAGAYLGFQQLNLAQDQLAQNKKIFNLNFQNQAQSINTQMEDRYRAKLAAGEQIAPLEEYMSKNALKTTGI